MGRIKSLMIKKAAKQLLQGETSFTIDFKDNKTLLGNKSMPSKPIRNKVAGYISRLIRMKKSPRTIKIKVPEERPQYSRY